MAPFRASCAVLHHVMCCVTCCAVQDVPTAYAYELEAATIVQSSQVVDAVERMVAKVLA